MFKDINDFLYDSLGTGSLTKEQLFMFFRENIEFIIPNDINMCNSFHIEYYLSNSIDNEVNKDIEKYTKIIKKYSYKYFDKFMYMCNSKEEYNISDYIKSFSKDKDEENMNIYLNFYPNFGTLFLEKDILIKKVPISISLAITLSVKNIKIINRFMDIKIRYNELKDEGYTTTTNDRGEKIILTKYFKEYFKDLKFRNVLSNYIK